MSSHSHHQRNQGKKSSAGNFFSRLFGKEEPRKKEHRSHFPGINLPEDYDPAEFRRKSQEEALPGFIDKSGNEIERKEFYQDTPEFLDPPPGIKKESTKRRPSLKDKINLYFQMRDLRREERMMERLKKQHRREIEEDYRKMNAGPGLGEKLFNMSEEREREKERKIPLLSQQNPLFRNLTIAGNSLMIFLITYVLVYLFYWLTSIMVASVYGLDSTLYYYDLKFNNHSQLWDRFNILMVTGIPPFFSLFLGIFLYKIIFKIPRFAGLQKLFVLWSAFHLINHFFGAFPSGIITNEGFGYVAAWMYMNTAFKFLFALISLFILGVIGFHSAKHILETSDSLHRIKSSNRLPFMLYQMAFPWLVGTIFLLLVRAPHNFDYPYETLMLFSMAFLVIPSIFNEKVKPELNLMKVKKRRHINMGYVAMMLVLILFLRIVLGIGLHFIIEINVSISPATS